MSDNFGYVPDSDKIEAYAESLPTIYGDDVARLVAADDDRDVFLYRGLIYCLKKCKKSVRDYWLINDDGVLRLRSFNQGNIGCHTPDTEVLTIDGWKLFTAITTNDRLASVNPKTQELIFEHPTQVFEYDYDGDIYGVNHRYMDFAITGNHKMLVRKWNEKKRKLNKDYEMIKAENLGWYTGFMSQVQYKGEKRANYCVLKAVKNHKDISQEQDRQIDINLWLQFLGLYIAEGTMIKIPKDIDDSNGNLMVKTKTGHCIQIAASKTREKKFARTLFESLGIRITERHDRFILYNKQMWYALKSLGLLGVKAPKKCVPDFIFTLPAKQIKQFLIGHRMGDGSKQHGHWSHYTSSKKLAEDIQRLLFLSGKKSFISERPPRSSTMKDGRIVNGIYPEYRIGDCNSKLLSLEKKKQLTTKHYVGKVYCAEVPTYHTLVTRRNGKILISGNSCVGNAEAMDVSVEAALDILIGGEPEEFQYMASPEALYAIGREAGGMLGGGDGSYGSAMAEGEVEMGTLWQTKYGDVDLSTYSVATCRTFGRSGIPRSLKPEAAKHKVESAYRIKSVDEAWALIGAGNPINQCSTLGFSSRRDSDGACRQTGVWGHSMAIIGRRTADSRKLFLIINSWGDDWVSGPLFEDQPPGSFYADYDAVARAIGQRDVFVKIGVNGIRNTKMEWDKW